MTGAIEFLQKAKAICDDNSCIDCPIYDFCDGDIYEIENEADLVRKVMSYQIEEESHE